MKLPSPDQVLGNKNTLPSPSDVLGTVKKKVDSKPRSQEELWGSDSQPQDLYTSLVTGAQEPQQESDGLGGPPSPPVKKKPSVLFPETPMGRPAASVMYEAKKPTLVESTPIEAKPKKYYRIVSDEKKAVEQQISDLEQRNARLGRTPESLNTEGTYQALQKQKAQLDQEFEPAQTAIKQIQRQAAETNQPFERIVYGATDGKYSYFTTDIINLNKDVEDKIIDSFDSAPEEIKKKWYKGSLPVEAKEEIINSAKNEVLTDKYNVLKNDADNYIKNIKDNPSIPLEDKLKFQKEFKEKSDGFNSQLALDYSGKLLKNNFKVTDANKGMDEAILSKYKGFIPDTVDVLSTFVEGMGQVGAKVATGIPSLALIGAERFNQLTGISKPEDYTAIEATEDWINDTTNLNFLPSSQTKRGNIVVDGEFNPSYYSMTKTLAKTLPFTLKIISDVKKGRIDGTAQSMISQLINPKYSKDFADKLRVVETAYKGTISDNYRDAKEMGMDDSKSFLYANTMALAEGVSENIMPDFKYFDSLTGSTLKAAFKGGLKQAVTKQAAKNVTKDFFKNFALETGEEEVILATEDALKYSLLLNHKNSEFFNMGRQKELVATTALLSGALGTVSTNQKFKQNKKDLYNTIHNNIYDLQDAFLDEIDSPLNDQKAKESLITAYKFANDVSAAISNAPENVTADQIDLLVKKKNLEEKKKNIDPAFHPDINEEIAGIDAKIRELAKIPVAVEEVTPAVEEVKPVEVDNRPISERQAAVEKTKPAEVKPSGQKVADIINRPATLESQAGVKLDTPIEGDVYQEGQRVIFEDKNKKTYDLGNIDEVSDKTVEELGIKPQEEMVSVTPEGKIKVGENQWNMQLDLPNYGIEYDQDGNVKAVSLKDDAGKTVMYEGQVAEDAAYQVLLNQAETPEQRQAINEILENDEELNRQLREAEEAAKAAAAEVTEPGAKKAEGPEELARIYKERITNIKESDPEQYWSVDIPSDEVILDAAKNGRLVDKQGGMGIVTEDGNMVGMFKYDKSAKGTAKAVQGEKVKIGGKKLDNFDGYLTNLYEKNGFRVVSRVPFNEQYAPEGWKKEKHGTPDVVAMIYDPEGKLDIEEKTFDDYDEAMAYRDSYLEIEAEIEGLAKLFDESDKGFRMSQVDNAKKALDKILPGVEFIVHETKEAYNKAVGDNSSGTYIMSSNGDRVIHINKQNANGRTVAHEVFHAVILDKIKGEKAVQEITARMVDAVYKTASPELRAELDAFAARYSDKTIRDEERLAELLGIIADGYPKMSQINKGIVKRWLEALAKMFGRKPFTDNEVIDLLNTLARKVSTGEVISEADVKILGPSKETIKRDVKRFQNDFVDPVSGIEFVYDKNTDTFKDLEKEGYITKNKSIRDFNGKFMLLHQPDGAFSGLIYKNGELLVEGKGGVYYPIKFHKDGYFWASTSTTAKKMAEDLNKVYDANNGQILMAFTSAKYDKLLSSTTAANGIMEIMLSKAFDKNFSINKQQIKTSLINAANKIVVVKGKNIGLGLKIKKGSTLEEVKSEIAEKLGPDNSVFGDRKMFAESLISNVADIIKNNPKAVEQFNNFFKEGIKDKQFKGTKTKGSNLIKISATNLTRAISEMLTEPMLKEGVDRINGGQVYAILELNGKVIDIPSKKHESYPKAIQSKDLDNKVKLHILTDRVKWNNVFEDPETGDIVSENREKNIYPTFGVSTTGLKLNTKNLPAEDKTIKRSQKADDITIERINFEEESEDIDVYEASETAEKIAKNNGINILKGKELINVALNKNGDVVGGLWTEVDGDEFSFDIAVDKTSQGKGIGEKLVNEAISEFDAQNYEDQLKYKIDVTNPIMEKLLSKYGFEVVDKFPGHTIMEHPTNNPKLEIKRSQLQEPVKNMPAGNRLFNKPLPEAKEIADNYYKKTFGKDRVEFKGTRELDKENAKRISDAFIAMKHDPNNPKVKASYRAMAKETLNQYKYFLKSGYKIEINNEEPYSNSEAVIEDLRNNKRIKIFSTESGFGDNPITAKERSENPLLKDSGYKDANGQPLLINDVFRAVHDFFGHAELGNSFGPLGEENAWNVHARMYSDLAKGAVTTETRGQNSYVNFSGVNKEIDLLREKARKFREEGNIEEADKITNEIYEKGKFADQKIGLLPEEFSKFPEDKTIERLQQAKTIDDMVRIARQSNYSDAAITAFLKTKGFSDAQIANALVFNSNRPSVNKIYEDSKKAIDDKKKRTSIKDLAPFLRKSLLDRQAYIKRVINKIDNKSAKKAYDLLVTKAGASALASERFKRAEKKIYGGLNSEDTSTLDKIIYAKRMVAVNESRAKLGLEPYKGMDGYSIDDANQDLADFKRSLGDKKFNDLSNRATEYFDVFKLNLKKLYESGRISKEVYESLKDTEYSPIKTIKYIIGDNLSVDEIDAQEKSLGIARKDIMKLSDSNENEIILDSKWLLAMSINSVEGRAFENNMLREFDKAIKSATPEEKKAFEDIVLDNPVVGTKKDGSLKYKYDETRLPVGYTKVSYFNDGNKVDMVLKDQYAKQLLDVKNKNKALETIGSLTGTKILRFFATGGNPLFIIGNTAVDFQNIAFFSNVYSKFKPMATAQLARDYTKNFVKKLVMSNEYNTIFNEYINHGGALDYMASDGLRSLESMNPVKGVTKAVQKGLVAYGRAMSLLGETSEVAFRLSVFQKVKEDAIKDFKKDNNREPNAQELDDILWNAGRQSRETMDFSQGGDVAKNIDTVFPYFNAALQGIRRPIDFATKDPVGFSSSVLQYTAMASSLAAGSFAMLISAVGGDDDDDEKKAKKIINVLNSVSEYEKANYHIMFTGNVNKDGEYEYYRAKKLPVLSVISTVAEQLIYKAFFNSKGVEYDMDSKAMLEAVNKSNPLPVTVQEIAAKNPVASGLVSYWANKDTFTGDKIFREPDNKKILPEAEGMFDDRVDQIYKDLAPGFGLSPARTKVMVEKVITSANTNPTIPLIYSAYDGLFNKNDGPAAEAKEAMKNVGDAFGKKLVRYTDKNIIRYKNQDEKEYQESVLETKVWNSEQKVYNEIKKKYDGGGNLTNKELINLVKENFEPMDYMKYAKKYNAYIHNMNIDKTVLDIIFEDVPEVQAMKLNQRYGPNLESEELKELGRAMNSAGKRINNKSIYIYNKKYKNRKDAQ